MARRGNNSKRKTKAQGTEDGALMVRKFMIDLFDREDGRAANWPLIAETLFKVAFEALDEVPADAMPEQLLRRVHDGVYSRLVSKEKAPLAADSPEAGSPRAGEGVSLRRDFRP